MTEHNHEKCGDNCAHNHSDDNMQQKYIELQMLDQQIRQIQEQIEQVDTQITEFNTLITHIDDFQSVKEGTEILVPISSGIFAKATLKDNKEFLVNVGNSVNVKKSAGDTKQLIKEQIADLTDYSNQLSDHFQQLLRKLQALDKEIS